MIPRKFIYYANINVSHLLKNYMHTYLPVIIGFETLDAKSLLRKYKWQSNNEF
jgi:hypothetical protein